MKGGKYEKSFFKVGNKERKHERKIERQGIREIYFENEKIPRLRIYRSLQRWLSLAHDKVYFWEWHGVDANFGPLVPTYMQGIWRQIGESRTNFWALRLLREALIKRRRAKRSKSG